MSSTLVPPSIKNLCRRRQARHPGEIASNKCDAKTAAGGYVILDDALSPDFPLGVQLEAFIRREDAARFIDEVRGDDPDVASYLRIEEREWRRAG